VPRAGCTLFVQISGFGSGTVVGKLIIYCKSAPLSGGSVRSTLGFTVSAERPVTTQPSIIPKNSDGIQEESRGILYTGVGRRPVYCKRWGWPDPGKRYEQEKGNYEQKKW